MPILAGLGLSQRYGGVMALRTMMADARLANPAKFAHVRRELGIDASPGNDAAG